MATAEKRRGSSISLKMILTTTALIIVVVTLFGLINYSLMSNVYDEQQRLLNETFLAAITKRGTVQTRDLVYAARAPILENNYTGLQGFVPEVAKGDPEVVYALVADKDGTILAHSDRVNNSKPVTDPIGVEMLAVKDAANKRSQSPGGELYVFARPVEQEGQRVGTVVIAYSLRVLAEQTSRIEAERATASSRSLLRTVAIGLIFALFGTAIAIFQGLRISRPIKMLAWRADQLARGDLESRVEISSTDEIGMLGENFNYMADRLVVLMRETAEKATLEKELEVARAIQETLVPSSDLVDRKYVKVAGYFLPASQCGGDWWAVHDLADDKVLVIIGDVTGHGVPAAMITAAAKAACDTIRAVTQGKLEVTYLLQVLNRAIFESAKRKFVMTCFASIIDTKAKTITYANAGHNFPYLLRKAAPTDGSAATQDFQVLMARGNRLGDLEDSTYTEKTQSLESGDVLVWYTDGIVECENDRGEEYGEKRFRAAIKKVADSEPIPMREAVVGAASQFFGDRPRKDDITMVFARIYS